MARILLCEIVTPEHIVYTNEVEMIVAPALDGELGILPLHAPMVAALKAGEVRAKYDGDKTEWFAISGGYLQVHEDKVIILADDAVASSQIDVERARQAAQLAQQRLAEIKAGALNAEAAEELSRVEADMTWAEVQVKVASAHR
jgi:F-type H+-transporting ATPase subunit epsilon